jgi:16S rRNA (cytosine967-C5)-methyltransferase
MSKRIPSGARDVAADVVMRVLDNGAWTQPTLASALDTSGLDARDKGLCTELVYGTLRWAASLERSLLRSADKPGRGLDQRMRPHLLVAAYQLQHLHDRIPAHAAVSESVTNVKRVRPGLQGFANALLRKLGSPLVDMLPQTASVEEIAEALGVPGVLAVAIAAQVEAHELRDALVALNGRPSTFACALGGASPPLGARPHAFVPGVFVFEGGAVSKESGFAEGRFVVMDPGSATCALLVARAPGMRVIDLCAAPGGKTALLASLASRDGAEAGGGIVVAVEKSGTRARLIKDTLTRTKLLDRVDVLVADALEARVDPADAVLLDAPCSGFGTTRRKPEIKLRRTAADVTDDALLQAKLLERALELTKRGGVLVYSVCSPIAAEGADHIERLLSTRADITVEDARAVLPWLPGDAVDGRGCIRLLTHRHDADGFFIARLRKRA